MQVIFYPRVVKNVVALLKSVTSESLSGDAEMGRCQKGHYVCLEHLTQPPDEEKVDFITCRTKKSFDIKELEEWWEDYSDEYWSEFPINLCPVCNKGVKKKKKIQKDKKTSKFIKHLTDRELFLFALRESGLEEDELMFKISEVCQDYADFKRWISNDE